MIFILHIPRAIFTAMSKKYFNGSILFTSVLLISCTKTQPAPAPMPPPEVGVVRLEPQSVTLTRELPGRTSPFIVAEVRPQVTGLVQERAFTEGALVKKGQLLYKLDDATL